MKCFAIYAKVYIQGYTSLSTVKKIWFYRTRKNKKAIVFYTNAFTYEIRSANAKNCVEF